MKHISSNYISAVLLVTPATKNVENGTFATYFKTIVNKVYCPLPLYVYAYVLDEAS